MRLGGEGEVGQDGKVVRGEGEARLPAQDQVAPDAPARTDQDAVEVAQADAVEVEGRLALGARAVDEPGLGEKAPARRGRRCVEVPGEDDGVGGVAGLDAGEEEFGSGQPRPSVRYWWVL
ncbi:MAG: hypothetical protein U0797_05090 [Gemmataceae bacterium]